MTKIDQKTKTIWRKVRLGEVATLHRGYDLPVEKMIKGEYPVIFSNGEMGHHKEYKIKCPGVVTGRSGTLGNAFYIEENFWPHNTTLYVSDFHGNNQKFVYYLLKSLNLARLNAGSGVPTLNRNHVHQVLVDIPENPTDQKRIADVLSAFDDKIELNNKISKNLEQTAQAIFKEWFINFKFPGHEKVKMINSELGEIPDGWKVKNLGEIVTNMTDRYSGDNTKERKPYIPIDIISSKKLSIENTAKPEEAQSSLIQFCEDDILFGAMRPYFHKVAIAPFDGLTRTTCFVLRPLEHEYFGFSVMLLFSNEVVDYATSHSEGTTIPYAKWNKSFENMPVVKPPKKVALDYNKLFSPLISRIKILGDENQKLSTLRDLFLPKLMSGKIKI